MKKFYTLSKIAGVLFLTAIQIFLFINESFGNTKYWQGIVNSNWNLPANWDGGSLPSNGSDIVIDPINYIGNAVQPIISSASGFGPGKINVQNGGIFTIQADLSGNHDVTVDGNGSKINLTGGTFSLNDALILQNGASFNQSAGSLILKGHFYLNSSADYFGQTGGTFQFENNRIWYNVGTFNSTGGTVIFDGYTTLQYNGGTYSYYNLTINSGAKTFNQANAININVAGNWTNSGGNYIHNNSDNVTFNGNGLQNITGSVSTAFYDLTINKSVASSLVALGINTSASHILTLTNGGIYLSGKTLSITNSLPSGISRTAPAFIKCEKKSSPYGDINWTISSNTGTYVFPFGKSEIAADYVPFTFNAVVAGIGAGKISVSTYSTLPDNTPFPLGVTNVNNPLGDNSANVADRFWIITPSGFTTNPTASATFVYSNAEVPANSEDDLVAQRWNGFLWQGPAISAPGGQIFNAVEHSVTALGITNFSPWTVVRSASPLPVTLLSFDAILNKDNTVDLQWQTASETNTDYFTLERSDNTGNSIILQTDGAGNSSSTHAYHATDLNPADGICYYCLKQTDQNGIVSALGTVSVEIKKQEPSSLLPNPITEEMLALRIQKYCSMENITIQLTDIRGNIIFKSEKKINACKSPECSDKITNLYYGIYILCLSTPSEVYKQKLVVMKK